MGKRVDWTEEEMDKLFTAVVSLAKERPNIKLLEAVRLAQLTVLTENRRRNLVTIDHVTKYLRERFITNNMLPKDWENQKRKQHRVKVADSRDIEMEELRAARIALNEENKLLEARVEELEDRIKGQVSPLELIEDFFARIIRKGLRPEEPPKPHGVTLKMPLPEQERARRKDPMGFTASLAGGITKPKFAIVSSFDDVDKGQLHRLISGVADMRYIDGINKFTTLGRFNADGGRIILWTDKCQPSWEAELQNMGVSFHRHKGPQSVLVQHIKEAASK